MCVNDGIVNVSDDRRSHLEHHFQTTAGGQIFVKSLLAARLASFGNFGSWHANENCHCAIANRFMHCQVLFSSHHCLTTLHTPTAHSDMLLELGTF
jgi:hypothetical protein